MLEKVLKHEDVIKFIKELGREEVYQNKDIPNKINGEKISKIEYPIYIFIDAIVKYSIIIDDIELFNNYLDQLKRIIKKVESHNDIQMGVIKLLIKYATHKLNLTDINTSDNKKKLIEYFYNKYIVEGYFYHSFPSIYKEEIIKNGLSPYNKVEDLENINNILSEYKIEEIDSKDKSLSIKVTDSTFMAYYYAVSSPSYLKKLCINQDGNNKKTIEKAYLLKDYNKCRENINEFIKRKNIKEKDKIQILDFFDKEWNRLNIENSIPTIIFIKRKYINKNSLPNYNDILEKSINTDVSISIRKILQSVYNDEEITTSIPSDKLTILELPDTKILCKKEDRKKESEDKEITSNSNLTSVKNEVGNATIVALLGVLLITLGVTIMIIMLGK